MDGLAPILASPECLLVGTGDNGGGDGGGGAAAASGGGDNAEGVRDGEEAEASDVAGFAADGDDVGESEADDEEAENHGFDENVAQNAGLCGGIHECIRVVRMLLHYDMMNR